MFDRRFDEPEEEEKEEASVPAEPAERNVPDDIPAPVPSISEILDTLSEQVPDLNLETPVSETPQEEENQPTETPAPPPPPPPPSPPPPGFTEEEMQAARDAAFEEGHQKGLEEGRKSAWDEAMLSVEKQQADTLEKIASLLKEMEPFCQKVSAQAFETAVEFAFAVCKKILPALNKRDGLNEIRALLEQNFRFLKEEPKISIRLNPALADPIKQHIAQIVIKESYPGKIAVIRDENIALGDCRIEWKNGGLERNTQDILNQTEELLRLYGQSSPDSTNKGEQHG